MDQCDVKKTDDAQGKPSGSITATLLEEKVDKKDEKKDEQSDEEEDGIEDEATRAAHEAHSQEQVCPYTGKSYPCTPSCMTPNRPEKSEHKGAEEASEEPAADSKKHLKTEESEDSPKHFEVDTMEFRSSDGNLSDYGHDPL
jgi:hypothetical protein